ncbi:MAG: hypothetical protein EOO65_04150, partial [Methanosarcinales archaeon]
MRNRASVATSPVIVPTTTSPRQPLHGAVAVSLAVAEQLLRSAALSCMPLESSRGAALTSSHEQRVSSEHTTAEHAAGLLSPTHGVAHVDDDAHEREASDDRGSDACTVVEHRSTSSSGTVVFTDEVSPSAEPQAAAENALVPDERTSQSSSFASSFQLVQQQHVQPHSEPADSIDYVAAVAAAQGEEVLQATCGVQEDTPFQRHAARMHRDECVDAARPSSEASSTASSPTHSPPSPVASTQAPAPVFAIVSAEESTRNAAAEVSIEEETSDAVGCHDRERSSPEPEHAMRDESGGMESVASTLSSVVTTLVSPFSWTDSSFAMLQSSSGAAKPVSSPTAESPDLLQLQQITSTRRGSLESARATSLSTGIRVKWSLLTAEDLFQQAAPRVWLLGFLIHMGNALHQRRRAYKVWLLSYFLAQRSLVARARASRRATLLWSLGYMAHLPRLRVQRRSAVKILALGTYTTHCWLEAHIFVCCCRCESFHVCVRVQTCRRVRPRLPSTTVRTRLHVCT